MKRYGFLITAALLLVLLLPVTAAVAKTNIPYPSDTPYISCYDGTISPAEPAQAYVGSKYSCTFKFVPGCGENISGVVFEGVGLPDGLSMSSEGVVSGTPTTEGTFEAEIHVSGGAHEHVMQVQAIARNNTYTTEVDEYFSVVFNVGPEQPNKGGNEVKKSGVPTGTELVGDETPVAPPQTGDSNMNWLWAVAAAGAACAVAAVAMRRREN